MVSDVKRWLARTPGWLLVFDNADHPDAVGAFLPPAGHHGRVLVTTRCQSAAGAALVPLDGMDTDEGVQLLVTRARIDAASQSAHDAQVCRDLVSQMGGLPLALDQAGAFIDERKCGVQRYAALYREHAAELMEERGWGDRYPASVATTWTIDIDQVRAESSLAIDLLQVCAFPHPDAIPVALAEHILPSCASFGPHASAAHQVDNAMRVLMRFSLLGRRQCAGPSGQLADAPSMHRLVQDVASHADTFDAPQRRVGLKALAPQLQVCAGHVSAHYLGSDAALRLLRVLG